MGDAFDIFRAGVIVIAGVAILAHFKNKQAIAIANTPIPILSEIIKINREPGLKQEVIEAQMEPALARMGGPVSNQHFARFF